MIGVVGIGTVWNAGGTQLWQPTATGSGPNSAEAPVNAVGSD